MGKLLVVVLAPFRFPVLQVFPDLPDNPAVLKAMVMVRRLVFPSPGKAVSISLQLLQFYQKEQNNQKSGPTFRGKVFRLWGMLYNCREKIKSLSKQS